MVMSFLFASTVLIKLLFYSLSLRKGTGKLGIKLISKLLPFLIVGTNKNVHRWSSSMNIFGTWINALISRRFAPRNHFSWLTRCSACWLEVDLRLKVASYRPLYSCCLSTFQPRNFSSQRPRKNLGGDLSWMSWHELYEFFAHVVISVARLHCANFRLRRRLWTRFDLVWRYLRAEFVFARFLD